MKRIVAFTTAILAIVVLGYFYSSWYSYEKNNTNSEKQAIELSKPADKLISVDSFDPNINWSNVTYRSTDVLQGSHPVEGETGNRYAWVKKDSKIELKNIRDKSIIVNGYVPFSSHQKASGVREVVIEFLINGQHIKRLEIHEDQSFEEEIPFQTFQNLVKDNQCLLEIHVNNEFIPSQAGLGSDSRELSMMVKFIGQK
ncbi:hypothetical protein [Paenibacillus tyrfis]|uniref:Glycosyl hydrolase family 98 putative carbohydrate-binding module domain-containing protein n=1 Tax=Paenibacillus tyrfis TaxID=1501230 RepID=A0A081PB63_9BACL|nr:hypothetical protein [Paenibacillus tyrfis]KEQ27936.1 hypothetical protein ET33_00545 [Paenibacillus tyrfis]